MVFVSVITSALCNLKNYHPSISIICYVFHNDRYGRNLFMMMIMMMTTILIIIIIRRTIIITIIITITITINHVQLSRSTAAVS